MAADSPEVVVPRARPWDGLATGGIIVRAADMEPVGVRLEVLRRVEKERDEALADVTMLTDAMPCGWCDGVGVAPAERFGRDPDGAPVVDEDQPCPKGCELPGWLVAERNDAADVLRERDEAFRGRLAAQAEMDERRAERDAARAALKTVGEQRDLARTELVAARTELEHMRENMRIQARVVVQRNAEIVKLSAELEQLRAAPGREQP